MITEGTMIGTLKFTKKGLDQIKFLIGKTSDGDFRKQLNIVEKFFMLQGKLLRVFFIRTCQSILHLVVQLSGKCHVNMIIITIVLESIIFS